MTEHRARVILLATTVIGLVGAALFFLSDPPLPPPREVAAARDSTSPGGKIATPDSAEQDAGPMVVASDIFSATRAAPTQRYNPNAGDAESQPVGAGSVSPYSYEALPRLSGVVRGPAGTLALMQPDSEGASGRLYRTGDRIGGYRVVRIDDSSVVVAGQRGRVRIRVNSPDSSRR